MCDPSCGAVMCSAAEAYFSHSGLPTAGLVRGCCCRPLVFASTPGCHPPSLPAATHHLQTSLEPLSPTRSAGAVFKRSQALWGGPSLGSLRLRSSRSFAALEKLERPQVQVGSACFGGALVNSWLWEPCVRSSCQNLSWVCCTSHSSEMPLALPASGCGENCGRRQVGGLADLAIERGVARLCRH